MTSNRFSAYTTASTGSGPSSEYKNGEQKKDMWSSMLDSVASGKRLPEKNMLVLGGSVESQRDFLEALSTRRNVDRQDYKIPPVANSFALGYTYYDVLDTDQEDILARVSLYLLSKPSPSFAALIKPLLTPETIRNTLIVVLLDWSQPWAWMRQMREWLLLLRTVLMSLSLESKETMEEVMVGWRDRGRQGGSVNLDGTNAVTTESGDVALPLGPGEWEDGLGLPLCVVCQNSERIDYLEKSQGWKEEKFDLVLQYLRTVLLKHGASLIYTTPSLTSPLQSLVHASLGIHSILKRQEFKANVIDRDKIVVPPNWDSWGKIRVLRDGFDVEAVSGGWAIDLDMAFPTTKPPQAPSNGVNGDKTTDSTQDDTNGHDTADAEDPEGSAVAKYEAQVEDASLDSLQLARNKADSSNLEAPAADMQVFLATLVDRLDTEKKADEAFAAEASKNKPSKDHTAPSGAAGSGSGSGVDDIISDHIGPVQFNMGGIQVDADDMVQKLKDRQVVPQSPEPVAAATPQLDDDAGDAAEGKVDTERLAMFFGNLMNRKTKQ